MFCIHCGKEIADDLTICNLCGGDVQPVAEIQTAISNDPKWSTGDMFGLIVASILIPLVGVIFGIVHINSVAKREQAKILLIVSISVTVLLIAGVFFLVFYLGHHPIFPTHPTPGHPPRAFPENNNLTDIYYFRTRLIKERLCIVYIAAKKLLMKQ